MVTHGEKKSSKKIEAIEEVCDAEEEDAYCRQSVATDEEKAKNHSKRKELNKSEKSVHREVKKRHFEAVVFIKIAESWCLLFLEARCVWSSRS